MKEQIQHYIKLRGHTLEEFASTIRWSRMKLYRKLADPKRMTLQELAEISEGLKVPMCNLFKHTI